MLRFSPLLFNNNLTSDKDIAITTGSRNSMSLDLS
jgi:hypothetical protein